MNKLVAVITLLLLSLAPSAHAIYEPSSVPNNKVGIHILDTSELDSAKDLVNSNGGAWGYVTVPIQPTDRDKDKWNEFMKKAKENKIIPILRITTIPQGGTWQEGKDTDLVHFANFLTELEWPIENRYIIIFNEVNRAQEWGGEVNPRKYARILKNSSIIFKERSDKFFILPAGLDSALPNSDSSMTSRNYILEMESEVEDIWSYIDGWTSHSYPNPGFAASPYKTGWQSITSYKNETALIDRDLPIFITETGWDKTRLSSTSHRSYYAIAWNTWLNDSSVVAVTPFLLSAGAGDFAKFSFINEDGSKAESYEATAAFQKTQGEPKLSTIPRTTPQPESFLSIFTDQPAYSPFNKLISLENIVRSLLNMPKKEIIWIDNKSLTAEIVTKPSHITKGLSNREHLAENHGMLFVFEAPHIPTFWMKDMNFSLDMIWLKDGVVVDITENVPPASGGDYPIYSPNALSDAVLEVNAGFAKDNGIEEGDKLVRPNK